MKKSELKQIIKEEVKNILKEGVKQYFVDFTNDNEKKAIETVLNKYKHELTYELNNKRYKINISTFIGSHSEKCIDDLKKLALRLKSISVYS